MEQYEQERQQAQQHELQLLLVLFAAAVSIQRAVASLELTLNYCSVAADAAADTAGTGSFEARFDSHAACTEDWDSAGDPQEGCFAATDNCSR